MAKPTPELHVESSGATVNVRSRFPRPPSILNDCPVCWSWKLNTKANLINFPVIDTTAWLSVLNARSLIDNPIKGMETLDVPVFSFLIEHASGRMLVFDLGVRKDFHNLAPIWSKLKATWANLER